MCYMIVPHKFLPPTPPLSPWATIEKLCVKHCAAIQNMHVDGLHVRTYVLNTKIICNLQSIGILVIKTHFYENNYAIKGVHLSNVAFVGSLP